MQQFDKEKAIKILTDELSYAYCDNCRKMEGKYEELCFYCYNNYQEWALAEHTARYIINRIIKEATYAI